MYLKFRFRSRFLLTGSLVPGTSFYKLLIYLIKGFIFFG
jgi:hypothetical protein